MQRYEQDRKVTKRNHRNHLKLIHGWPKKEVTCICDLQAGRFRKRDAFDCGKTLCQVCHYEKWLNNGGHEETRKEKLTRLKMKEQLQEL